MPRPPLGLSTFSSLNLENRAAEKPTKLARRAITTNRPCSAASREDDWTIPQAQSSYGSRGNLHDVCVVARHCGGHRHSQIFPFGDAAEIPVDAKHLHLRAF